MADSIWYGQLPCGRVGTFCRAESEGLDCDIWISKAARHREVSLDYGHIVTHRYLDE